MGNNKTEFLNSAKKERGIKPLMPCYSYYKIKTQKQNNRRISRFIYNHKDGFTINQDLTEAKYKNGFFVGLTNNKASNPLKAIENLNFLKNNILKDISKKLYFGGWFDKKEKCYYLDFSIWLKDKAEALKTAKLFNQLAVWDIQNQKSIYLNEVKN